MPSVHGFVDPISWTHFSGVMTHDDVEGYLRHHEQKAREAQERGTQVAGLVLHYRASAPNAAQRHLIANAIHEHGELLGRCMPVFAYVFDSSLTRGGVTAVSWLVKKPFEERIFRTPDEALRDLSRDFPSLDAAAVWADIERLVPEAQRFPYR